MESNTLTVEEDGQTYVHLIGPAIIRHEGGQFIIEFVDAAGKPLGANGKPIENDLKDTPRLSLTFSSENVQLKLMNMHLIVQIWNKSLEEKITTLNKAFPFLKVVIQTNEVVVQAKDTEEQTQEGETKKAVVTSKIINTKSLAAFMTPTDPPKQNKA